SNRPHVEFFRNYFLEQGIPATRIFVTEEVGDKMEATATDDIPFARRMIETTAGRLPEPVRPS
ncbi:MAG TPA: hypothetical protein VFR34_12665, partial [Paracoccaceae bacterium]|nr:hypothetical protein [Paracoccaceae bacterium]